MFKLAKTHASPDRRAIAREAVLNSCAALTPRFRAYVHAVSGVHIEEQ
jgi:hypothetical protein